MYQGYWKFTCNPFENDANPQAFFRSETHQSALLKLRYLVENHKGAGVLVGGTGFGKSYLIQMLTHQLAEPIGPIVQIVFPQLSAAELLAYLAVELGADQAAVGSDQGGLDRTVREIERLLKVLGEQGRNPVIVIDEAHLIEDVQVFQALRLLLNFQQPGQSRFSLIFVGQRELLNSIRRIGQLEERVTVKCLLRPLSLEETSDYVACRLEAAGATTPLFQPEALATLHELSGGVPRRINRLCDLALLVGFADESRAISAEQVAAVGEELAVVAAE